MTAFVLVPGACHGGWWYEPLVQALTERGHTAVALTLAGLEADPDAHRRITLDTHVGQVTAAVEHAAAGGAGPAGPVVVVAHNDAGTPCTAAADRRPDLAAALVLLDAFLPEDGDTCWAITTDEQREWYATGCARTGDGVEPQPFFDERATPPRRHPAAAGLPHRCLATGPGAPRRLRPVAG